MKNHKEAMVLNKAKNVNRTEDFKSKGLTLKGQHLHASTQNEGSVGLKTEPG